MKRLLLIIILLASTICSSAYALDPASYDLNIQANEDYRLTIVMKNMSGNPVNLSGYSYKAQGKTTAADAVPFVNFSSVITDAAAGKVVVSLSKAQSAVRANKQGYWDLLQTAPSGLVSYYLKGILKFIATVTR